MYYLTWNPDAQQIEATFGGSVTKAEVTRFSDELRHLLMMKDGADFRVLMDVSTVNSISKKTEASLDDTRDACLFGGAKRVTVVTGDVERAQERTTERMTQVLDGTEQYMPFLKAA